VRTDPVRTARKLAEKKLSLIVWGCYRPKRAVDDFLQWSQDPAHAEMKTEFYPRTDKEKLFDLGYPPYEASMHPSPISFAGTRIANIIAAGRKPRTILMP
jgi:hypothetical protein